MEWSGPEARWLRTDGADNICGDAFKTFCPCNPPHAPTVREARGNRIGMSPNFTGRVFASCHLFSVRNLLLGALGFPDFRAPRAWEQTIRAAGLLRRHSDVEDRSLIVRSLVWPAMIVVGRACARCRAAAACVALP